MEDTILRQYQMLASEWNERQRRLWAASEAIIFGRGGISVVSRVTGLSRTTITEGIKELENNDRLPDDRVRREGGGRKKHTVTQPKLLPALDALVEPTAKGDPMSPLRWTTKSTRRLATTLQQLGFNVSKSQVCRLLEEEGCGYQWQCTSRLPKGSSEVAEFVDAAV
jgi:transposase